MIEPTNQLIYEIVKSIKDEMADMRHTLADHSQQFINIRDQIHGLQSQIHDLQGDMLRQEKNQIAMAHDIDRIKRRLQLVEAE